MMTYYFYQKSDIQIAVECVFQGYPCFMQNRPFKQGEQINGNKYLIYNSYVLGNKCA